MPSWRWNQLAEVLRRPSGTDGRLTVLLPLWQYHCHVLSHRCRRAFRPGPRPCSHRRRRVACRRRRSHLRQGGAAAVCPSAPSTALSHARSAADRECSTGPTERIGFNGELPTSVRPRAARASCLPRLRRDRPGDPRAARSPLKGCTPASRTRQAATGRAWPWFDRRRRGSIARAPAGWRPPCSCSPRPPPGRPCSDYWDMDGDEAAETAALAIDLVLEGAPRPGRNVRRRSAPKRGQASA